MKSLIFYGLLLLLPLLSVAQGKLDYAISKSYGLSDNTLGSGQTVTSKDGITAKLKLHKTGIVLQIYDSHNMRQLLNKEFDKMSMTHRHACIQWVGNRLFYFSIDGYIYKPTGATFLCQEIDLKKGTLIGKRKELFATAGKVYYVAIPDEPTTDLFQETISCRLSKDASKLLIQYRRAPAKVNDAVNYDLLGCHVVDLSEEPSVLASGEVTMPYVEQAMDNEDWMVTNEGVPYLLAKVRNDGSQYNYRGKESNHHLEILRINPSSNTTQAIVLKQDNHAFTDVKLYEGANNQVVCAGYYNQIFKKKFPNTAEGAFIWRVDADALKGNSYFYPIPLEVMNAHESASTQRKHEREADKGHAQIPYLRLQHANVLADNSILLVGEQAHLEITIPAQGSSESIYYYDDVFVTKITVDNKVAWTKKLPKQQIDKTSIRRLGVGYVTLGDRHYFAFVDHEKNLVLNDDQEPKRYNNDRAGQLVVYSLDDATGELNKSSVFNTKKVKEYSVKFVHIDSLYPVSDNAFLLNVDRTLKEDLFVKVTVQ